ncbi:MAG: flippase [Ruminococcaceae bacterium]|nr:flippase [Oscillospiraceae bacterium]
MKLNFLKSKEVKNAGWLIGGKIAQMILSLFVGVLSARYLGPSNYGLISYGSAMIGFFMSFCTLGINSVIIKEFFDNPDEQGKAIGSSIVFRLVSSFCSCVVVIAASFIIDRGSWETIVIVALCSVSLLFHVFDTINYWFQAQHRSKVTAIATFIAYVATSVYKIILLILNKSVFWFAFATSVDYIVLSIILLIAYKKYDGPKLSFSFAKGKSILGKSYHYILSGMMVAIYGHTDKLMLKQMMNTEEVGYYATATAICAMWTFVLTAIIDSMYPTIVKAFKTDQKLFENRNRQLYAIVFYVSVFVSVIFLIFGNLIIRILYGAAYMPAAAPLKVVTWYTAFSYFGVARTAWIVCNDMQKYLKYMYIFAAILNVALNLVFIPIMGAIGAALASLITQIFTSIVLPYCIKDLRPNAKLMLEAIILKDVLPRRNKKNL